MTRNEELINHIKGYLDNGMDRYEHCYFHKEDLEIIIKALEQEPKTGYWIEKAQYSDGQHKIECSECGNYIFSFNVKNKYSYCPNCGVKMESEE